jgi:hypothetical protein
MGKRMTTMRSTSYLLTDLIAPRDLTGSDHARCENPSFPFPRVLIPYDKREGMTLDQAAKVAGKSRATLRRWCIDHNIGRRVGGGEWIVSRVALAMHLDGNEGALGTYLLGDRESERVLAYFRRMGVPSSSVEPSSHQHLSR